MSDASVKARPRFRNLSLSDLLRYRLPLAGKVSILHRISGLLLTVAIPLILLPLFDKSVSSEISHLEFLSIISATGMKLVLLVLLWGFLHHFVAGIRYLLLDLHIGVRNPAARQSSIAVLVVSLLLTVLFGLRLFGVF